MDGQGRRHVRLHADVRPRRLGSADRRRRARRLADAGGDPDDHRAGVDRLRGLRGEDRRRHGPCARATAPTPPTSTSCFAKIKADFNAKWWDAHARLLRARTPRRSSRRRSSRSRWRSTSCPPTAAAALQEKLIEDIMVTRAGHEMVGIVGSRWIFPVLTAGRPRGRAGRRGRPRTRSPSRRRTRPTATGTRSAGRRWASTGRRRRARAPTTCSARSGSGSTRAWRASRPLKPGYAEIAFRPLIASGIDHAAASYDSVRGEVKSSWEQVSGGLKLDVTVPPNATGLVYVPGHRSVEGRRGRQRHAAGRVAGPGRDARRRARATASSTASSAGSLRVPRRPGRVRLHRRDRDRRRHGAGDVVADARRAGAVRRVHAGRGEGLLRPRRRRT